MKSSAPPSSNYTSTLVGSHHFTSSMQPETGQSKYQKEEEALPCTWDFIILLECQSSFKSSHSFTKLLYILSNTQRNDVNLQQQAIRLLQHSPQSHSLPFSLHCQCYYLMAESEYLTQLSVEKNLKTNSRNEHKIQMNGTVSQLFNQMVLRESA